MPTVVVPYQVELETATAAPNEALLGRVATVRLYKGPAATGELLQTTTERIAWHTGRTKVGLDTSISGTLEIADDGVTLTVTVTIPDADPDLDGSTTITAQYLTVDIAQSLVGANTVLTFTAQDNDGTDYTITLSDVSVSDGLSGIVADNGTTSPEVSVAAAYTDTTYTLTYTAAMDPV